MKKTIALLCLLLLFANPASADWFLSSETKALIAKAEAGDAEAQFAVGGAYDSGKGAPHDEKEALKWYTMAAEHGHAEAQNSVGSMLQAYKRYAEARGWYEKAAAQGNAEATNSLAYLYDLGLGVPQNRQKGFEIYTRAADLGWAQAMWNIAVMYDAGQVGPRDPVKACTWARRASKHATPRDARMLRQIDNSLPHVEAELSAEQLETCRTQAAAWSPAGPRGAADKDAGPQR